MAKRRHKVVKAQGLGHRAQRDPIDARSSESARAMQMEFDVRSSQRTAWSSLWDWLLAPDPQEQDGNAEDKRRTSDRTEHG